MQKKSIVQFYLAAFFTFFIIFFLSLNTSAERLSFKTYTTSDGLASDSINTIKLDSRGFLWFCTSEGLSRFDGYNFKTYTQDNGLPHRSINDFLETQDGTYLVATNAGLAVFNPNGKSYHWNIIEGKLEQTGAEPPIFKTYSVFDPQVGITSKNIYSLAQDGNGNIFAGTNHGLFRVVRNGADWQFEKIQFEEWDNNKTINFNSLFTDSRKDIWIAASNAIYLMSKDGAIKKINEWGGNSVFEDHEGKIWVDSGGNNIGIRVYTYQNDTKTPVLINSYSIKDGLPVNGFSNAVAETDDGRIFVTSEGKLCEFLPNAGANERKFRILDNNTGNAATDKSGNIWFNLPGKGVARYSPNNFTVYDERDGIPKFHISSIFTNQKGDVFFTIDKKEIMHFDGDKIDSVIPFGTIGRLWGDTYLDFESATDEWWITSGNGLRRYPKLADFKDLAKTPPKKIYTMADGLFSNSVFNLFEDSSGDIWISATDGGSSLARWDKATDKLYPYTAADGLPGSSGAVAFAEDAAGNVWIGFFFGQMVRYKDGKFYIFSANEGIPEGTVSKMLSDSKGRLWIATSSRGLFRVDDPNSEHPTFKNFSTGNGLSSNQTFCLAEDKFGRIYAGTGRGLNRLDPETNQIKLYTQADGLPGNVISQCIADKSGILWLGSNNSLIRFQPQKEPNVSPPPIFIEKISVNGVDLPISELGESNIENLEFTADQKQIQISFFALLFGTGERLLYQYKLNKPDWSPLTDQRTLAFNLAPGNYTFEVRAINSDGVSSDNPAKVSFRIMPPVWQRWWFITLAILFSASAIFALDRYRVSKTRQVARALNETKRANILIRESENRFRTLADTASDAIFTIDEEGRIIFVNEAVKRVFGYTPDELIGQKMGLLIPENIDQNSSGTTNPDSGQHLILNNRNLNSDGIDLVGLHKSGNEIPLEVSFGEFKRDEKRYFTGIARDISERIRAEAELQKMREEKFAELQRVRKRIATDLHDDIGSSLTQIAVLSEVARGQANHLQTENLTNPLERIKSVSKELVAVMSDIVWAINPNKDFLHDLVQRMRRFASDVFTGRGIKFEFHAPEFESDLQLGANIRREVFAIFKESVNNAVKYSACTQAKAKFQFEENWLILSIEDNGKGFDVNEIMSENFKPELGGNGLINMKRRANELGGSLLIESVIDKGTKIIVRIPL